MNGFRILLIVGIVFFLMGCTTDSNTSQQNNDVNYSNITTKRSIDQSVSNKAKQTLQPYEELKSIKAVNAKEDLVIAIDVYQNNRFRLADIRKKLQKKIKNEFPSHNVELSTDKKLIIELDKLENQIKQETISRKKLQKEIKHLIKLNNEQT